MPLATEAEADREYARNVGRMRPESAWILSDRDAWYPNPFYQGPPVRHPEDYDEDDTLSDFGLKPIFGGDDEIPF